MSIDRLIKWAVIVLCFVGLVLGGCAKKSQPSPPEKTAAQHKAEADKQITEQNANQELENLEKSIDQEAGQEQ